MIGPGTDARVLEATRPVDFRKGAGSLAAMVKAQYGADPCSGVVYVFRAKRADRVKLIWWDGTALCLMAKTLAAWPSWANLYRPSWRRWHPTWPTFCRPKS